ncbi:MAG: deoxyribodipyrimidine photolyase-related protein [Cognaticolwellia sp.]|jgi:deoxyribodipyrimidine photolyase-related protein
MVAILAGSAPQSPSEVSVSSFQESLRSLNPKAGTSRAWVYVPYDQLSDRIGPLSQSPPQSLGIVLIESTHKPGRRLYHKQKLAWILSNQRHFALEQAARGVAVDYRFSAQSYAEVLTQVVEKRGTLRMMEAAERELRLELAGLVAAGHIEVLPHQGWLSSEKDFAKAGAGPFRMDAFYRHLRKKTGILMQDGKPEGGKFSHDAENRKPWRGEPPAPTPPSFQVDAITQEVLALIQERFAEHPGELDGSQIPASKEQAQALWAWAKQDCMTHFGPFEDAMSTQSRGLFHTRIAPLVNLHRLLPQQVVDDVLAMDIPLNSKEGFVRQILGWREFVRHIHRVTDGMRSLKGQPLVDPLERQEGLPAAYWMDSPSGLRCLDAEVQAVWETGWTHHIPRLMVLSNIATLLDVVPQQLSDWFWVGFVDAYDWVVEPNVVGMGTYGVGNMMTTKPYVSGANYIHKMGDACASCAFHPKKSCPITPMYWAFLGRHAKHFEGNHRMNIVMASLRKRSDEKREMDLAVFEWVRDGLRQGQLLAPQDHPQDAASLRLL